MALGSKQAVEPLKALLDMSQADLRVIPTNQEGGACVTYQITVPQELGSIAVLDASWPIRELERMDTTIREDQGFDGRVKRYDRVTIRHLQHGSGRKTMDRAFAGKREDRTISHEIVEVVKAIPHDQAIIVFTFKKQPKGIDFKATLQGDLSAAGIDPSASIPGHPARSRFVFLTWGQETSLSEYAYCSNVIFAGVLHRSHGDISGAIIGQSNSLTSPVTNADIARVIRSEVAHSLYQAMSRGSCRMVEDGQAKAMNVWLIHPDPQIRDQLMEVMPGVQWKPWEAKHLETCGTKTREIVTKVMDYLAALPDTVVKVSTRQLKKTLCLTDIPPRTFTRTMTILTEGAATWVLDGRSLIRITDNQATSETI